MIFNERVLRVVVTLAEELHFRRTADRLHLSQPALSGTIKCLERELGVQIFRRSHRKVELTEAGKVLVSEGRRLLEESEVAVALVRKTAQEASGHLRVGFSPQFHMAWLASLASQARREGILGGRLEWVSMGSDQICQSLAQGLLNAAFLNGRPEITGTGCSPLFRERYLVAMADKHPLAGLGSASLDQLADVPVVWLRREADPLVYDGFLSQCARHGYYPNIVQEVSSFVEAAEFAYAGVGITFLPASAGSGERGASLRLDPDEDGLYLEYLLVCRTPASAALRQFAAFTEEYCPGREAKLIRPADR
jgi:DNA-binding transcriptional LysR family regulator